MKKKDRQEKILNLIETNEIETQKDLMDRLLEDGFDVTQATISRDIRELKLNKVALNDGRQKYVAYSKKEGDESNKRYYRILREGLVSMDMAQNILVIKTMSGMAMAVAAAIDKMQWMEVVGTIAGDDTVMCAIRSVADTKRVMDKIRKVLVQ